LGRLAGGHGTGPGEVALVQLPAAAQVVADHAKLGGAVVGDGLEARGDQRLVELAGEERPAVGLAVGGEQPDGVGVGLGGPFGCRLRAVQLRDLRVAMMASLCLLPAVSPQRRTQPCAERPFPTGPLAGPAGDLTWELDRSWGLVDREAGNDHPLGRSGTRCGALGRLNRARMPSKARRCTGREAAVEGLSDRSRWLRFFSAFPDLAQAARWATKTDNDRRYGLVATVDDHGHRRPRRLRA
jgi:hypothetical protein